MALYAPPESRPVHPRCFREGGVRAVLRFLWTGLPSELSKQDTQLAIVKPLDEIAVPCGAATCASSGRAAAPAALRELNRERGDISGDARFAADLDAGYGGFAGFNGESSSAATGGSNAACRRTATCASSASGSSSAPGRLRLRPLRAQGPSRRRHRQRLLFQIETALHERGYERLLGLRRRRQPHRALDLRGARPPAAGRWSARASCGAGTTGSCRWRHMGGAPQHGAWRRRSSSSSCRSC